ncbi:diacylglycerol kinase family protein [Pedobacter xixiisoli]|uniref:Undecaprenol kinase/diacylglycerol kinase (ATP) n=1 Tax=Pedobacter xixiisoli TaxID=1476464 RepID=A0A286AEV6_9SPHI|nr:diacylglycerol kinase family protein [Pedobacter xixiisoli]SOD20432.1 undecaprenol kinase/diacylglycerol kinase (ATP) [Pedobacter xixiisoli]
MLRFFKSFRFASNGLKEAFKSELNFKVHLFSVVVVVLAGWCFEVSFLEWIALIVCISAVLATELFNTAIEVLVNLVSPEFNPKAGLVKDIAAAAVLIVALMSLVVGLIIFVPKIF